MRCLKVQRKHPSKPQPPPTHPLARPQAAQEEHESARRTLEAQLAGAQADADALRGRVAELEAGRQALLQQAGQLREAAAQSQAELAGCRSQQGAQLEQLQRAVDTLEHRERQLLAAEQECSGLHAAEVARLESLLEAERAAGQAR